MHNPSSEDISVTKRLAQASEILGINLRDHLVLGGNAFVSLRARSPVLFRVREGCARDTLESLV